MSESLLPIAIQDAHNVALEECIKESLNIDLKKFMLVPIENVNENLLPFLAKEAHITGYEGWNLAKTHEQKVNLIKNSFLLHAKKGTMETMLNALINLNVEADIKEWQDYGGRIGHFKVEFLNIFNRGLDENFEKEIVEVIKNYKPLTRILDTISYFLCSKGQIYTGVRLQSLEKVIIRTKEAQL